MKKYKEKLNKLFEKFSEPSNKEINIKISNLKEEQVEIIEAFLSELQYFGAVGHSGTLGFFADGDGDFHPDIKIDGKKIKPNDRFKVRRFNGEYEYLFDTKELSKKEEDSR